MNNVSLFDNIINEFHKQKILPDLILLGSWCLVVYKEHYKSAEIPLLRTQDIDLMVPYPKKIKNKIDIYSSLNAGWKKTILHTANKYSDNLKEMLNNRNIDKGRGVEKSAPASGQPGAGMIATDIRLYI